MRAAISLLVSSLVFSSLAINHQTTSTRLSDLLMSSSDSQQLIAGRSKTRPNQPQNPVPHRGSGRSEA
jgi:hypothetical protein